MDFVPKVLAVAVVALVLAVAFFLLLAYLLIAGKPTKGALAVTAGNSKLDSSEGGILLAVVIVLLVVSATTWPGDTTAQSQPTPQNPTITRSTSTTPTPSQESALNFVNAYLEAMASPNSKPADLDSWFVFPATFYSLRNVTDRTLILKEFEPKSDRPRTTYQPPVPVGFQDNGKQQILYVTVDYQRETGSGQTRVKYLLEPSSIGQPFRIRSVTDEN